MNKSIYLINNGLTCKDVYEKINEFYRYKKKQGFQLEKEHIDILKKYKREKINKLSLNGIIEARELKKNNDMDNLKVTTNYFYCLCDRVSIETALIYLNKENKPYCKLIILPFIKFEKSIRVASDITEFKKSFGTKNNNNMRNFWNINSDLINYRKSVTLIWSFVDASNFSKIKNYNLNNLMENMLNFRKNVHHSSEIILFCNDSIIRNFLKTIKDSKFKPESKMKIYNTHCLNLNYVHNSLNNTINLKEYSTYYPKKLGNNTIKYDFQGKKYELFYKYFSRKVITNKLSLIPKSRCVQSENLNKILIILNKGKTNNSKKNININNVEDFENIFQKMNKKKN